MSVLRNLEARIEGLVEGVFSRAFSSQVQPVEIARKLAKEMDSHKTASVSQTYAPNSYTVWLSPEDHERLEGYTRSLSQELSAYLLEHARRQDYALLTRPEVMIETDERLRLGEFGIQPRLVKPPARKGDTGEQGQHGHTMVYSAPAKEKEPRAAHRAAAPLTQTKAIVSLPATAATCSTARSPCSAARASADCVIDDQNVSRRHAELRRNSSGDWQIVDLGSTNGVKVNGRRVDTSRLAPGDEVSLGTITFIFDIEQ